MTLAQGIADSQAEKSLGNVVADKEEIALIDPRF
jgi:hypothetical protein